MQYPNEILPQSTFKLISTEDIAEFSLIRHIDDQTESTILDENSGLIKTEFIANPTHHARDLSTSLFGIFTIEHTKIRLTLEGKSEYGHDCAPNAVVNPPIFNKHFDTYQNRTYWIVKVSDIHNQALEYTNVHNNEVLKAECLIEHTPMKWNFWHFSIRWKFNDGRYWHEMEKKDIEKYSRKIGHETKSIISKFAQLILPEYQTIPQPIYSCI